MTVKELAEYLKNFPHQDAIVALSIDEEGNAFFKMSEYMDVTIHTNSNGSYVIFYPGGREVEF